MFFAATLKFIKNRCEKFSLLKLGKIYVTMSVCKFLEISFLVDFDLNIKNFIQMKIYHERKNVVKNSVKGSKSSFTNSLGFVLAAAGSAVGLGNIWRFPYLAAKNGGLFVPIYIILAFTFGFALLTTDIALGRKTGRSSLDAYSYADKRFKFVGWLSFIVPCMVLSYYSVVGGWITKYMVSYFLGDTLVLASDGYFSSFVASPVSPLVYMLLFLGVTALIVYMGVEKGIEKFSKIIMPGLILLIIAIAIFSLFLSHTDANGVTRTGFSGLGIYLIPDFSKVTLSGLVETVLDAVCQLFYSLSVSMGIMVTYGSYVDKKTNLGKSIFQIELFDTGVALLSGLAVIPAVYVFMGMEGMTEGAGLIFVALPKIFEQMGFLGAVVGAVFFVMVLFAALTSSVSIMETIVASIVEKTGKSRKAISLIIFAIFAFLAAIVCAGYNVFYFDAVLPNGTKGQILDVLDYISNYLFMPIVSIATCVLIGWVKKPDWLISELQANGESFKRRNLYCIMIKYVAPITMAILFIKAIGIF